VYTLLLLLGDSCLVNLGELVALSIDSPVHVPPAALVFSRDEPGLRTDCRLRLNTSSSEMSSTNSCFDSPELSKRDTFILATLMK